LTLAPSNGYVIVIERLDVEAAYQHRFLELLVTPVVVDQILALKGTLDPLIFEVREGKVANVRRAPRQ
jgi:Fe2+ transport system protein FeoA